MHVVRVVVFLPRALFLPRATVVAENLALRQQLCVLQRSLVRPRLWQGDRVFWVWLSRLWADWRSSLVIGKPEVDNRFGLWRNCGVAAFNMCNMVNMLSGAKSR